MNKYDKERIDMIIVMLMYITKLPESIITELVKNTNVYRNIISGDELTIYEGYSANLVEMIEEWKNQKGIPIEIEQISLEKINKCNAWLKKK